MTADLTASQAAAVYGTRAEPSSPAAGDAALSRVSAEVVSSFVSYSEGFTAEIASTLAAIDANKAAIRSYLLNSDQIVDIPDLSGTDYSIAAIDGGFVVDSMYSMDLLASVAVTAEGLRGNRSAEPRIRPWANILHRDVDNGQIARMRMLGDELLVLTEISHDVRLIDGSHMNPFVALAQGISRGGDAASHAVEILDSLDLDLAVAILTTPGNNVASLAKGDTSTVLAEEISKAVPSVGSLKGMSDKALVSMILEDGEMLKPHRMGRLADRPLNFGNVNDMPAALAKKVAGYNRAVEPLRDSMRDGLMRVAFIKPRRSLTAVRIQFVASVDDPDVAFTESRELVSRIAAETVGPDLQEPFPQYAADMAAKTVSHGLDALKFSILASLPEELSDYASLIMRGYRT